MMNRKQGGQMQVYPEKEDEKKEHGFIHHSCQLIIAVKGLCYKMG